jgi:CIC family chloride channel protein
MGSLLGVYLRFRRNDLRMIVGCGAGGAIAAAFGAPLTGAFYAFELIVGTYSVATAAPIMAASVAAVLTTRALGGSPYSVVVPHVQVMEFSHYLALIFLGLLAALVGVATMRAVSIVERGFEATRLPQWLRPAVGGLIIGALTILSPQVLAAGHGAMGLDIPARIAAGALVILIALKLLACLVSLASGFRGGLFFASLFVGSLVGKLFAVVANAWLPVLDLDPTAAILAGMGTLGVAVVGGPLTMSFLVLESTGNFGVTAGVLAACIATSLAVRTTFGYSFSTWRLHLRGESIRSAQDVSWIRNLTVERLMRRDPTIVAGSALLADVRAKHPLGSAQAVIVANETGAYAGLLTMPELHSSFEGADRNPPVIEIAKLPKTFLHPDMNVKSAMTLFDSAESELLAVVSRLDNRIVGLLTEAYTARRYAEEVDQAARGVWGGV